MKKRFLVLFACLLGALVACSPGNNSNVTSGDAASPSSLGAAYRQLTPDQAKEKMTSGEDFFLLDVRTPAEFEQEHLPGARLIPEGELPRRAPGELPDQSALILVYCRTGRRSEAAARALVAQGYTNVYDLGGILDWPYETVSPAGN